MSKSQLVDEALALFAKAIAETRHGRRLGFVGRDEKVVEFSSPALSLVEWAIQREPMKVSGKAFDAVTALNENPPAPTPALLKATGRRRKRS